jgi:hypothetical protein
MCSPASTHRLRLLLYDKGFIVNTRAGSNSFYTVRALLPVPAVELERDPAPTEADIPAADARVAEFLGARSPMQLSTVKNTALGQNGDQSLSAQAQVSVARGAYPSLGYGSDITQADDTTSCAPAAGPIMSRCQDGRCRYTGSYRFT